MPRGLRSRVLFSPSPPLPQPSRGRGATSATPLRNKARYSDVRLGISHAPFCRRLKKETPPEIVIPEQGAVFSEFVKGGKPEWRE
jgi:hypothetical protein